MGGDVCQTASNININIMWYTLLVLTNQMILSIRSPSFQVPMASLEFRWAEVGLGLSIVVRPGNWFQKWKNFLMRSIGLEYTRQCIKNPSDILWKSSRFCLLFLNVLELKRLLTQISGGNRAVLTETEEIFIRM